MDIGQYVKEKRKRSEVKRKKGGIKQSNRTILEYLKTNCKKKIETSAILQIDTIIF